METEACPVSRTTSTAAGSSSSPSSCASAGSAEVFPPLPFSFSFTACSILSMTSREYSASPVVLTKPTTRSISSGVMKQPCTRVGFPAPSGA